MADAAKSSPKLTCESIPTDHGLFSITETQTSLKLNLTKFGMNAKSEFICIFVTTSKQKFIFDTLLGTESLRLVCFI